MATKSKLQSQKIADRIRELEAEQREALEREDREADALLLRLARKSHMRSEFIKQARGAVKQHERELARARETTSGQQGTPGG